VVTKADVTAPSVLNKRAIARF